MRQLAGDLIGGSKQVGRATDLLQLSGQAGEVFALAKKEQRLPLWRLLAQGLGFDLTPAAVLQLLLKVPGEARLSRVGIDYLRAGLLQHQVALGIVGQAEQLIIQPR
ncbi:hypothetical protein D3C80_1136780 [compost metagenome]